MVLENKIKIVENRNKNNVCKDYGYSIVYVCLFQLPSTVLARILLNHYKWDLQTLISEYYDNQDNQDAFFEQVKVANPFKIQLESAPDEPDSCKICFLDMEPEVSSFSCTIFQRSENSI